MKSIKHYLYYHVVRVPFTVYIYLLSRSHISYLRFAYTLCLCASTALIGLLAPSTLHPPTGLLGLVVLGTTGVEAGLLTPLISPYAVPSNSLV